MDAIIIRDSNGGRAFPNLYNIFFIAKKEETLGKKYQFESKEDLVRDFFLKIPCTNTILNNCISAFIELDRAIVHLRIDERILNIICKELEEQEIYVERHRFGYNLNHIGKAPCGIYSKKGKRAGAYSKERQKVLAEINARFFPDKAKMDREEALLKLAKMRARKVCK